MKSPTLEFKIDVCKFGGWSCMVPLATIILKLCTSEPFENIASLWLAIPLSGFLVYVGIIWLQTGFDYAQMLEDNNCHG